MVFKQKGGVKGLLNNVKKNALFLRDGFPKSDRGNDGTLDRILHHKWCGGCLLHPEILCVVESQDVGTGHEDLETT